MTQEELSANSKRLLTFYNSLDDIQKAKLSKQKREYLSSTYHNRFNIYRNKWSGKKFRYHSLTAEEQKRYKAKSGKIMKEKYFFY